MARWLSVGVGILALVGGIAYVSRPPDYSNPNLIIVDVLRPLITPSGLGVGFLLTGILVISGWVLHSEITRAMGHTLGAIVYTMYGVALVWGAVIAGGSLGGGLVFTSIGMIHIALARKAPR